MAHIPKEQVSLNRCLLILIRRTNPSLGRSSQPGLVALLEGCQIEQVRSATGWIKFHLEYGGRHWGTCSTLEGALFIRRITCQVRNQYFAKPSVNRQIANALGPMSGSEVDTFNLPFALLTERSKSQLHSKRAPPAVVRAGDPPRVGTKEQHSPTGESDG